MGTWVKQEHPFLNVLAVSTGFQIGRTISSNFDTPPPIHTTVLALLQCEMFCADCFQSEPFFGILLLVSDMPAHVHAVDMHNFLMHGSRIKAFAWIQAHCYNLSNAWMYNLKGLCKHCSIYWGSFTKWTSATEKKEKSCWLWYLLVPFTYHAKDLLKLQEENISLKYQVQDMSICHGKRLENLEVLCQS